MTKYLTPEDEFNAIIDNIEFRAMAADGPVTPTLQEATEAELSRLWELVNEISPKRKALSRKMLRVESASNEEVDQYLINEGLDPKQVAREGLIFVKTLTAKLQLEKQLSAYPKSQIPVKSPDDDSFTVDVIVYGEDMLNIGYYDFKDDQWKFHTDTLVDMTDVAFVWMYAPDALIKTYKDGLPF